jgi:hypothetical protein
MKDYTKLLEITVRSQEEFNDIPDDYKGRIYIEFGVYGNRAIVDRKFYRSVEARENSSVEAWGNSSVEARENSSVVAWGNSSVEAWENSSVEARENSSVEAWGNSSVVARENSSVVARENSSVEAWGNSSVEAWGNSSVEAWGNSSVEARGNSSVEAWENSSVVATGNTQVVDRLSKGKIEITGNARIVYMPKNIEDFMNFYGIKHDKKQAVFFKSVHRVEGKYISDRDSSFEYPIGETVKEICDQDVTEDCGTGIHIAHIGWCLDFGKNWTDIAIIELEVDIDKIVLPDDTSGKVRTSEAKVIREVPLEECGVYGKILAKRCK